MSMFQHKCGVCGAGFRSKYKNPPRCNQCGSRKWSDVVVEQPTRVTATERETPKEREQQHNVCQRCGHEWDGAWRATCPRCQRVRWFEPPRVPRREQKKAERAAAAERLSATESEHGAFMVGYQERERQRRETERAAEEKERQYSLQLTEEWAQYQVIRRQEAERERERHIAAVRRREAAGREHEPHTLRRCRAAPLDERRAPHRPVEHVDLSEPSSPSACVLAFVLIAVGGLLWVFGPTLRTWALS